MGPLTSFLLSKPSEGLVAPLQSKLAEKALTPAEISRLAEDLVAEWQTDPELKARSLALVGKGPKDPVSHRDLEVMVRLLHATHSKNASVEYHGKTFPGYNKPIPSDKKEKKMMVLAKKGDEVKLVHFGQKGYQHNYSSEAKQNYLTRSAGIRNKSGQLTKDDPFSPNYWARKVLWPKGKTGEGHNGPVKTEVRVSSEKKAGLAGRAAMQVVGNWHLPVYDGDPGDPKAKVVDWYQVPVHAGEKVHVPTTFHPQHGAVPVPHAKYVPVEHKEKKASLFDAIAARKENEKWAAAAKLAEDNPLHHVAEVGGLGILAAPYAADMLKHRPGIIGGAAKAYDAALGHSAPQPIQHKMELAGLGTLAAPSVYSLGKWAKGKVVKAPNNAP